VCVHTVGGWPFHIRAKWFLWSSQIKKFLIIMSLQNWPSFAIWDSSGICVK
jgi:hypothetical protein